jgi:hypothetical protein
MPLAAGGATTAELLADLSPALVTALRRRPVHVLPVGGGVYAHLQEYGAAKIRLEVAGPGARLTLGLNHERLLVPGAAMQALVSVSGGDYAVAPGSPHEVKIDAGFDHRETRVVQADERGVLTFPVAGARAQVEISPEEASAPPG